jgi:L-fuconolactonase
MTDQIIDTHQHLWDLSRFRLPWLEGLDALNRSFTLDDYAAATDGLGVVRSVYMEVECRHRQLYGRCGGVRATG